MFLVFKAKMSPLLILFGLQLFPVSEGWWLWGNGLEEEDRRLCIAKPQKDAALGVGFTVFSRANREVGDTLRPTSDADTILNSHFDAAKDTKFIIHGYTDNGSSDWIHLMLNELLEHHDVNVIAVNWQEGADSLNYAQSAANTLRVGEIVGDFMTTLRKVTGAPYSSHHLIGHSLGSHISGFAGARVKGQGQEQVGRITGLDPAGPCFRFSGPEYRLSEDDAVFVDAIHTDGDLLVQGGFGTGLRMGDADFYPNGGEKQPECSSYFWQHLWDLFTKWIDGFRDGLACSHLRVLDLFRESINPDNSFKAYPCDKPSRYDECRTCEPGGCSRMGYYASPDKHGLYTLRTKAASPFSNDY